METRKLGVEDKKIILELEKLCFPNDRWNQEDWDDLLSDERATYYGLMDQDKLVGNVFTYNWKGEMDYIKIMNLSVHPDYRGNGYAHNLMALVKEELESSQLKRICAETRSSNKAMQKVFEDCYYKLSKVEENCYENPQEDGFKYVLEVE
ncbi:MAG: GNAT family N-acetyltransferase [Pseudobutyrivibrio sp.]|nr:GNAT family N-acetyltransferase [Pseudobutyrivibrio sp.]